MRKSILSDTDIKLRCDKLPVQSVVHTGDYLEEMILDPLSTLSGIGSTSIDNGSLDYENGGDDDLSIYMSPTKKKNNTSSTTINSSNNPLSPTRPTGGGLGVTLQSTSSSPLKSLSQSINHTTTTPLSPLSSSPLSATDYYCVDCKKGFQSEQTWNTHIGSTKHINQVKENKKKSTTVSSPSQTKTTNNKTQEKTTTKAGGGGGKPTKQKGDEGDTSFTKKQLELMAIVPGKPLLTCKNMFQAAKNYSQLHMINDCSKSLLSILKVLKAQQKSSSSSTEDSAAAVVTGGIPWTEDISSIEKMLPLDLKIDIWSKIALETKTYLYLARLTRLFDRKLTETFISKCLNSSSLLDPSFVTNIEREGSYRLFILDPNMIINQLTKIVSNSIQQHQKEQQQQPSSMVEEYLNLIDEMAGILSFDKCHPLSLFFYYLSISISFSFQFNERIIRNIQRCIRIFVGMDYHYLVSDFYLRFYRFTGENDLSVLCDSLKYAVQSGDRNRLRALLQIYQNSIHNNYHSQQDYYEKTIDQQSYMLILQCCYSVHTNNSLSMEETRDQFEHILSTDRDISAFYTTCFDQIL